MNCTWRWTLSNTVSARQGFRERQTVITKKTNILYLEKCSGQKERTWCGKKHSELQAESKRSKASQAGSHLGRMAFKLRMLIMRSCWPGQVLEEGHSKHEEQIQGPEAGRTLDVKGQRGLEHGDDWEASLQRQTRVRLCYKCRKRRHLKVLAKSVWILFLLDGKLMDCYRKRWELI